MKIYKGQGLKIFLARTLILDTWLVFTVKILTESDRTPEVFTVKILTESDRTPEVFTVKILTESDKTPEVFTVKILTESDRIPEVFTQLPLTEFLDLSHENEHLLTRANVVTVTRARLEQLNLERNAI